MESYDISTMNNADLSIARKRAIANLKNAVTVVGSLGMDFYCALGYENTGKEFLANEGRSAKDWVLKSRKRPFLDLLEPFKFAQFIKEEVDADYQLDELNNSSRRSILQRLLVRYRRQCMKPNVTSIPFKALNSGQRLLNWPVGVSLTSNTWSVSDLGKIDAAISSETLSISFLPLNGVAAPRQDPENETDGYRVDLALNVEQVNDQ